MDGEAFFQPNYVWHLSDSFSCGRFNRTALHWACKRGHVSIAQHLLESGAIANLRTSNGESVADVSSDPLVLRLLQESE